MNCHVTVPQPVSTLHGPRGKRVIAVTDVQSLQDYIVRHAR